MKLLGDTILAERLESDDKISAGGLHLPETANMPTGIKAKVLGVGLKFGKKKKYNPDFMPKIGNIVIVSKYVGTIIDKLNPNIRIYDSEDVFGIVDGYVE